MQEKTIRYSIDLPEKLHKKCKIQACNEGVAMRTLVIEALMERVKDKGDTKDHS